MIKGELVSINDPVSETIWLLNEQVAWLTLEVSIFFCNIFGLMIFLLMAYFKKYESLWKGKHDLAFHQFKNQEISEESREALTNDDIWNGKKSDDFLRYLKYEAFQFMSLFTSMELAFIG